MTPYETILRILRTIESELLSLRPVIDESVPAAMFAYTSLRNDIKEIESLARAARDEAEHPEEDEA